MKHGNKKGKAKAAPSGKKSKPTAKSETSARKGGSAKAPARPVSAGAAKARAGEFSFNNPVVAAAFRRAVKKYPSAFKRLTD